MKRVGESYNDNVKVPRKTVFVIGAVAVLILFSMATQIPTPEETYRVSLTGDVTRSILGAWDVHPEPPTFSRQTLFTLYPFWIWPETGETVIFATLMHEGTRLTYRGSDNLGRLGLIGDRKAYEIVLSDIPPGVYTITYVVTEDGIERTRKTLTGQVVGV